MSQCIMVVTIRQGETAISPTPMPLNGEYDAFSTPMLHHYNESHIVFAILQ